MRGREGGRKDEEEGATNSYLGNGRNTEAETKGNSSYVPGNTSSFMHFSVSLFFFLHRAITNGKNCA